MQIGILFCKNRTQSASTQLSAVLFSLHYKLGLIKSHIVTASGISVIIMTCFVILSLYNPVLIFKIAFTSSALILLFNFNFTTFIWPNTRSISALECGIGYMICVEQNQPVLLWDFSVGISTQAYFSPICYCVSNILRTDNYYQILPLVFNFPNDFTFFTFYSKFIQKLN